VQVVVQQTALIDKQLVELIDKKKLQQAITLQETQIELLRSVLELDQDGANNVAGLLKQAETALVELEEEGLSKQNRKKAHHRGYMKLRNSAGYSNAYEVLIS